MEHNSKSERERDEQELLYKGQLKQTTPVKKADGLKLLLGGGKD